ncbi:hypothetical protein B0H11DRAFT_2259717 [Mycena galericulata]|nr:hypothetical protein B0H11DRAFT_2259717 [Mycena galericulata]
MSNSSAEISIALQGTVTLLHALAMSVPNRTWLDRLSLERIFGRFKATSGCYYAFWILYQTALPVSAATQFLPPLPMSLPDFTPMANSVIQDVVTQFYVLAAEIFLYGAYAVMFGFYIHVIRTRGTFNNRFLTVATIALFILCTAHCALIFAEIICYNTGDMQELWIIGNSYVDPQASSEKAFALISISTALNRSANIVYIISNVIADSIFIFRCYAIWNFRWVVIILPMILTVAVAGHALHIIAAQSPDCLMELQSETQVITTFILMALSAGRIWWLARTSQKIVGQRVTSRYYTVCAMILESGALYCVGAIPFVGVAFASYTGLMQTSITTSGAILGQLVGIAPTIIAVRVGLGRSVENVDSFIAASQVIPHKRTPRMPHEFQSADPPLRAIEPQVLYLHPKSHSDCETEQVV